MRGSDPICLLNDDGTVKLKPTCVFSVKTDTLSACDLSCQGMLGPIDPLPDDPAGLIMQK